jgi:hypothetical protein
VGQADSILMAKQLKFRVEWNDGRISYAQGSSWQMACLRYGFDAAVLKTIKSWHRIAN